MNERIANLPATVSVVTPQPLSPIGYFSSPEKFEFGQRVAKAFASSMLVPQHLRDKPSDCLLALNMADRMQEDPLVLMQHIHFINGKAGFDTAYQIARANKSGIFKGRITWRSEGKGKDLRVTALATLADTGEVVEATVSMEMAEADGWVKNAKYRSMPEHMLRWRAAAFLIRLFAPDIMLGMPTREEIETIDASYTEIPTPPEPPSPPAVTPPPAAAGEETGRPAASRTEQGAPASERKPRSSKPYAAPKEPEPEPPAAPVPEPEAVPEPTAADDFGPVFDDILAAQTEKDLDEVMDMHAELIARADRKTVAEIEAAHEKRLAQFRPAPASGPDREELRQAWQAGFNAFLRDRSRNLPESPFKENVALRAAWVKGWDDAKARGEAKAQAEPPAPPSPPEEPEQPANAAEALAYDRGMEAKGKRHSRAAVPPEYRDEAKLNLANAWKRGWDAGSLPS